MSLSTEATYRAAVDAARSTRQTSKSVARTAYAFDPANLATYIAALNDADVAYATAVNSAADTLNIPVGNLGYYYSIPGAKWTPLLASA